MLSSVKILDIAGHLPEQTLTNLELEAIYRDWSAEKIFEKTGISQRHIACSNETSSDLAYYAAEKLFSRGVIPRTSIDFIIFCTQSPDYFLPTTACLLQDRLRIPITAGAIDINMGCSGFVYGLSYGKALIESGMVKRVLLLTAETYSKYIDPLNRGVRTIFGDGATATVLGKDSEGAASIGSFVFGTDGSGGMNLVVKSGGAREGLESGKNTLYMDGPEVLAFTLKMVPDLVGKMLAKEGVHKEEVDYFVFHQANKMILSALTKKLKIDEKKVPITMSLVGNTVSSSIPLALMDMNENGLLKKNTKLMLIGFGVGYSWAGCFLNY